jgi:hypothetical protein
MTTRDHDVKIGSIAPFGLRLHPDLKARIDDAARRNGRSLNAEIAARLEASLDGDDDVASAGAAKRLLRSGIGDDLEKRVAQLESRMAALETSDE